MAMFTSKPAVQPRFLSLLSLRFLLICLIFTIMTCFLLASLPLGKEECLCYKEKISSQASVDGHKLAVLVPFRDRFEELLVFLPHIHKFLNDQGVSHHIYILNQVDSLRFNRASLINVGFLESDQSCDYIAMHDVDLLPLNSKLSYKFPKQVFHVASPELHPRYNYPTFVGGILLMRRVDFVRINGMSNRYWGWGLEDDEFYARMKEAKINISRPSNIGTGRQNTFKHIHDRNKRKRDMMKCFNQKNVTSRRDRQTGLQTVSYRIDSRHNITIDNAPATIINVILVCDYYLTPWCDCDNSAGVGSSSLNAGVADQYIVPQVESIHPRSTRRQARNYTGDFNARQPGQNRPNAF